jgi:hypothetical protein
MANRKKPPQQKPQQAARQIRWRNVSRVRFLHLVDGRDTAEFKARFARWLAEGCHDALVHAVLEAEPEVQMAALRAESWKDIAALRQAYSAAAPGIERQRVRKEMDRILPRRKQNAIAKKLGIQCERIRSAHVESLVAQLSELPVYSQIAQLNANVRRLRNQGLIAKGAPWRIYREAVEDDYFWCHPELRPDEAITTDLVFNEELGGKTARAFARHAIPDEWSALEKIAETLATLPTIGPKPTPVWAALCGFHVRIETSWGPKNVRRNRLQSLLEMEYKRHSKALQQALSHLLRAHFRLLLSSPRRLNRNWIKNLRTLARASHRIIRASAGGNESAKQNLHDLHRTARHDPCVRDALRQFFFPGLSWDDLQSNRPLLGKLIATSVPEDIAHLLDFLLQDRPKKQPGLIPNWLKLHGEGSDHRRNRVLASSWPDSVAAKREGKKEAEIAAPLAQIAGVPAAEAGTEHFGESFARRRERLGLKFPR